MFAAVLMAGCAEIPQPVPEPLSYEDPAVPPPPVAHTERIREVAVFYADGSRGGAALRAREDLDVLHNAHYEGAGEPFTDRVEEVSVQKGRAGGNGVGGREGSASRKDRSFYSRR